MGLAPNTKETNNMPGVPIIKFSYTLEDITTTNLKLLESTPDLFASFLKKNAKTLPYTFDQVKNFSPEEKNAWKKRSGYFMTGKCLTRKLENLEAVYMLPFDLDHCPEGVSLAEVSELFKGYKHIVYTSFSHLFKGPRFRVLIFLKEAFSKEERALQNKVHRLLTKKILGDKEIWLGEESYNAGGAWFFPVNFKDKECGFVDGLSWEPCDAKALIPLNETPPPKKIKEGFFFQDFINQNLSFDACEEADIPLLSKEYELVGNRWKRRGSLEAAGGRIFICEKTGIELFTTDHGGDEVRAKMVRKYLENHGGEYPAIDYGKTRNVFQQAQWSLYDGDYRKTVERFKEIFPALQTEFKKGEIEKDFKSFSEEEESYYFEQEQKRALGAEAEIIETNPYLEIAVSEFPRFSSLMNAFNVSSEYQNPEFGFIAALAFGSIASNLNYTLRGLYANLQMDVFAETSIGKQTILDFLIKLMEYLEIDDLLSPSEYASDIAIYRFMSEFNMLLHLEDEAGLEAKINAAAMDSHRQRIKKFKMLIHSNTGKKNFECPLSDARLQKNTRLTIFRPFLSSIKISTPTHFKQRYSSESLTDGSLNRSLVFNIPIRFRKENTGKIPSFISEIEKLEWIQEFKQTGEGFRKYRKEKKPIEKNLNILRQTLSSLEKNKVKLDFKIAALIDAHGQNILSDDFDISSLALTEEELKNLENRRFLDYTQRQMEEEEERLKQLNLKYETILVSKELSDSELIQKYLIDLKTFCNIQYNEKKNMVGVYGRNLMHIIGVALSIAAIEKPKDDESLIKILERSKEIVTMLLTSLETVIGDQYTGAALLNKDATMEDLKKEAWRVLMDMINKPEANCTTQLKDKSRLFVEQHNAVIKMRTVRFINKGRAATKDYRQKLFNIGLQQLIENGNIEETSIENTKCFVIKKEALVAKKTGRE